MTASETFTLPDQPTNGESKFVPLGGRGLGSPLGYYQISANLDDAATTGYNSIKCFLDDRYTAIVSHLAVGKTQAAVANCVWRARLTPTQDFLVDLTGYDDLTNIDPQISSVRVPALEIVDGDGVSYVQSIIEENAIGDNHQMYCLMYVFDKNVRNQVPLGVILNSLGGR